MEHLDQHGLLFNVQDGFRKERSYEMQLAMVIHNITRSLDKSQQTDAIILDFSKAFNTVPHQRLLCKLNSYGIRGTTLDWIKRFLTYRQQRVTLKGKLPR